MTTIGLYGNTTESVGLYGNTTNFGGTYFEWFVFQESATAPATPTGGTWDFQGNTGTAPSGWSTTPPTNPTNIVWASIAIVNSRSTAVLTWTAPATWVQKGTPGATGPAGPTGPTGATGTAATVTAGTTTTLSPGSSATVTNSGTSSAAVFNFGVPKGDTGATGPTGATGATGASATIAVGTTTTLSPGSSAIVTNVGTSGAAVFNFGIPKGADGSGSGTVTSVALSAPSIFTVSGSPITSSGTLALTYSGTALPVANGGSGVTTSTGANSNVLRDANGNITTNSIFEGYLSVPAAGTTTTLTAASAPNYVVTGSGGQTFKLPDATTLPNGVNFTFNNNQSSGTIVVQNNSGTTIATVQSGAFIDVSLLNNSTAAGSWDNHNSPPSNASWSTNTLSWAGSYIGGTWNGNAIGVAYGGTGATSLAGANIPVTSAVNTFTATQTFNGSSSTFGTTLLDANETVNVVAAAPSATTNFYIQSGAVQYYTTNAANNWTLNIAFSSGTSLNTALAVGQSVTFTLVTTQGSTAYYNNAVTIDGTAVTPKWIGGAPTAGNASGLDVYRMAVVKTASATYTVLASLTQYK